MAQMVNTRLGNRTLSSIQHIYGTGLEGPCWLQPGGISVLSLTKEKCKSPDSTHEEQNR